MRDPKIGEEVVGRENASWVDMAKRLLVSRVFLFEENRLENQPMTAMLGLATGLAKRNN